MMKTILRFALLSLLTACGGGGGGGAPSSFNQVQINVDEPKDEANLLATNNLSPNGYVRSTSSGRIFDFRQGNSGERFNLIENDKVLISLNSNDNQNIVISPNGHISSTFRVVNPINASFYSESSSSQIQSTWVSHEVKAQWNQGINGKGVQIAVLDDFTADDISDVKEITLPNPDCGYVALSQSTGVYWCPNISAILYSLTHGQQVTRIISGNTNSIPAMLYYYGPYKYTPSSTFELGVITTYQEISLALSTPLFGVAFGANDTTNRNDYITYQRNTNGLFDQFYKWSVGSDAVSQGYRGSKVINLSLGGTSSNPVQNRANYDAQTLLANSTPIVPDAVFVKAVGNNGCFVSSAICDPLNAVFYNSTKYKSKTLLVGALNNGYIASYSNRAGSYNDRFIVADGRGIEKSDGTYEKGTSFAAPRVSGYVAMMRQKYPNLTAQDISDILLSTASWNKNWGLKDASTKAIYGQGEVNIERALNPIGFLP
jgi:hypothetical protein